MHVKSILSSVDIQVIGAGATGAVFRDTRQWISVHLAFHLNSAIVQSSAPV